MFWFQFQTLFHAHSFWLQENSQAKAVVVLQCLCRAANCRRKPFGMDLQPLGLQNAPTAVIPLRQSLWSRQSSTLTRKIRNGAVLHGTLSPIFGMENTKSSYVLQVLRSVTIAMLFFFQFGANDRLSSNIQSARLLPDSRFSLWHGGPLWMCFVSVLVFPRHLAFGFFEGGFPWFPCIQKQVDRDLPEICLVKRPLSWMWRQQISAPRAENAPTFVEFLDVLLFLVGSFWEIWHSFAGELKCLN